MFSDLFFNPLESLFEESLFKENKVCTKCDLDFNTYRKTGKLGCSNCYKVFKEEITPSIKAYHRETQHIGKCPSKYLGKNEAKLQNLNLKLKHAIEYEDYEEAARLRDLIKDISKM